MNAHIYCIGCLVCLLSFNCEIFGLLQNNAQYSGLAIVLENIVDLNLHERCVLTTKELWLYLAYASSFIIHTHIYIYIMQRALSIERLHSLIMLKLQSIVVKP